jgi:hypothetical protein
VDANRSRKSGGGGEGLHRADAGIGQALNGAHLPNDHPGEHCNADHQHHEDVDVKEAVEWQHVVEGNQNDGGGQGPKQSRVMSQRRRRAVNVPMTASCPVSRGESSLKSPLDPRA